MLMMTDKEFKYLKKLANAMRKNLKQIDDDGERHTTQEIYSLRELQDNAYMLLQTTNAILNRVGIG